MGFLINLLGGGALDGIYKVFVLPFLQVWLKSKDVDLEKHKVASQNTTDLAVAVLDANVKYAEVKSGYALSVLQWWPFRVVLFLLIAVCAVRFGLAVFDSTWWWIFGCTLHNSKDVAYHALGDACSWSIPAIKGTYGDAEKQFLLFFIVAKPVDTAVSGSLDLVSRYLRK